MKSKVFIKNYTLYVELLLPIVQKKFYPIIFEMMGKNPKDLILPDTYFENESEARGFIFELFVNIGKRAGMLR